MCFVLGTAADGMLLECCSFAFTEEWSGGIRGITEE